MSLTVKDLSKRFGPRVLFSGVTFGLGKGERVALIGPNGAGKTTLLQIVTGEEEADSGLVEKPRTGAALGYLAQIQETVAGRTIFEEALLASPAIVELRREINELEEAMATALTPKSVEGLADRYHDCLQRYEALDGYAYEGRVTRVLKGMGFLEDRWNQAVETLSGGERSQLELCKLLVEEPPLLLLDEPTNHLDLVAVEWLETFLQSYNGAILVVTHDRQFLDTVCTRILELSGGTLESYAGGYERYLEQKAERIALQQRQFDRQQDEVEKLTRFINRWRADAKRSKQAKSREKKLQKMERVTVERVVNRDLQLVFQQTQPSWHEVLTVEGLGCRFGARTLFQNLNFRVDRGERMAIIGRNGAGKTSLMRMLMDGPGGQAGDIVWGGQTEVGYFAQSRVEFEPTQSVFEGLESAHPHLSKPQVAALLGAVGFTGAEWTRPIALCSGGERSRIALAILLASRSNVLLLDEPTNHLDILAREALEEALEGYPGTVIFISHDRRFIDRLADKLLVVDGAASRLILGNYSHWQWVRQQEEQRATSVAATVSRGNSRPKAGPANVQKVKQNAVKLEQIIEEVDRLEAAIRTLHVTLADPELYKNFQQVQELQAELAQNETELAQWLARFDEVA